MSLLRPNGGSATTWIQHTVRTTYEMYGMRRIVSAGAVYKRTYSAREIHICIDSTPALIVEMDGGKIQNTRATCCGINIHIICYHNSHVSRV